jgi:hypothetical protein
MGSPAPNNGAGILIQAGDTFILSDCNIGGPFIPVQIQSITGGGYLANVFATNVLADGFGRGTGEGIPAGTGTGADGWLIDGTAGGTDDVTRIHLTNCWAGANIRDGFRILNTSEVVLSNCIAIDNQGNGFHVMFGCTAVRILGCTATGNSNNNSGANSGITIESGVNDFSIVDCHSGPTPQNVGNSQAGGITVVGTANDHYIITGNHAYGNITFAIGDGGTGTHKIVSGNLLA